MATGLTRRREAEWKSPIDEAELRSQEEEEDDVKVVKVISMTAKAVPSG